MIIQIINLSNREVFKKYSSFYNFHDDHQFGLVGLEIREISFELSKVIQDIIFEEKGFCYTSKNSQNKITHFIVLDLIKNIKNIARKILNSGNEELGFKIINVIKNYEEYNSKIYKIGNRYFSFDRSYIMGILNVTPDSFSDGGKYFKVEDAVNHALDMLNEGADIIDIGGESTRPGAEKVSIDEELRRIIPVLDGILDKKPETIISIDTTKKIIAEHALNHGAKIINDISSLTFEPELIEVIKKYEASLILMHMKGTPKDMQNNPYYENVVNEIYDFLFNKIQIVENFGIKNIFVDPGIGFGKRVEDNFELIKRLEDFKSLGYPILVGVSRKSFIGKTFNLEISERDTASAIIESLAIKNGARIIRTHNIKNGVQVTKLLNQLV